MKKIYFQEVWDYHKRCCAAKHVVPFAGTLEGFLQFIGVSSVEALEQMGFDEIEQLPFVQKLGFVSEGGRFEHDHYVWSWFVGDLIDGRSVPGRAAFSYHTACVASLLLIWEILVRRETQGK